MVKLFIGPSVKRHGLLFRLAFAFPAQAKDPSVPENHIDAWNQFRGPNGSGVVPDSRLPVKIGDGSFAWKSLVPAGFSSPVLSPDPKQGGILPGIQLRCSAACRSGARRSASGRRPGCLPGSSVSVRRGACENKITKTIVFVILTTEFDI